MLYKMNSDNLINDIQLILFSVSQFQMLSFNSMLLVCFVDKILTISGIPLAFAKSMALL